MLALPKLMTEIAGGRRYGVRCAPVAAVPICHKHLMHGRLKLAQMLHQRQDGLLLIEGLRAQARPVSTIHDSDTLDPTSV